MDDLKLVKLPQSAFAIRVGARTYAFDLGSEVTPHMLQSLGPITALFISHRHPDHLSVDNVRLANARTFGPPDVVRDLEAGGIASTPIAIGETVQVNEIQVSALQSDHGPNISAPIDNLAFLIHVGGKVIYFLGDMAVAPPDLPSGPFDALLIPVGGSKVFSPEEAAAFVDTLESVKKIIPIHYHGRADREAGSKFKAMLSSLVPVEVLEVGAETDL